MANAKIMHKFAADEKSFTMSPSCTGSSVFAIIFRDGVAVCADTQVSYGKMARYQGVSRIYKLNKDTFVAFGGDHADFQHVQNLLLRRSIDYKSECSDPDAEISPKAVHTYLTGLLYYRRTRFDPLWNSLVIIGMQSNDDGDKKPFIGIVNKLGVAYGTKFVGTGLGAFVIQQILETEYEKSLDDNKQSKMSRDEAVELLGKCVELANYHDSVGAIEFQVGVITADETTIGPPQKLVGNWEIADTDCQFY